MQSPTIIKRPDGSIWCEVCNKPVESVSLETPVEQRFDLATGLPSLRHTGEQILEVSCHGETARLSNWSPQS